jgi:hypothetical protein
MGRPSRNDPQVASNHLFSDVCAGSLRVLASRAYQVRNAWFGGTYVFHRTHIRWFVPPDKLRSALLASPRSPFPAFSTPFSAADNFKTEIIFKESWGFREDTRKSLARTLIGRYLWSA